MKDLAAAAVEASRRAGAEIMRWYGAKTVTTKAKADSSPVTAADLASHEILTKALRTLAPGVPVVSEESGASEAEMLAAIRGKPEYWLVDPLDGTRDFLARTGEFCICIALIRSGRPVLGVIHEPVTESSFVGYSGATTLKARKASDSPLFLVSRQHPGGEEARIRQTFPQAVTENLGSALKYARIAAGKADCSVRFTPTSLWDIAAGEALLTFAGGGIRALAGGPLDYSGKTLVHPPLIAAGDSTILDRFADQLMHPVD